MTVVHDFATKAREADRPAVRKRAQDILVRKIGATGFHWSDPGDANDRHGIDVFVRLPNGKQVGVDVKDNTWGEVRLEYVSREGEGVVGWTVDATKVNDYVLNMWPRYFWLIDAPCLRAVAIEHREKYEKWYGLKASHSRSNAAKWRTMFVPVPVGILLSDIYETTVMGTPLSAPRPCPSCHHEHPVGINCYGCVQCQEIAL